ncbi:hypothetical protein [Nocardioides speluncae]|uniref:hypothetical protein n=1 Tax=Nocardioides speluncae TaxID=2670337 RepID=UPI000D693CDA|nr:hypothetical protein [Nocardioides speluncae]
MNEDLDYLAGLREDIDRDAQVYERALAAMPSVSTKDETESVEVTVDRDGQIQRIWVSNAWERAIGADTLGSTILAAYAAARQQQFQHLEEALDTEEDAPTRARPMPVIDDSIMTRMVESARANPESIDVEATISGLLGLTEEFEQALDSAFLEVEAVAGQATTGESRSGRASATMSLSGEVTDLRFDEKWLPRAHPANIARETLEAIASAARARPHASAAELVAGTRFDALARIAQDPQQMSDYLRLNG